jgi:hypothetical protein
MDFMERMDAGRAERKRTLERTGGTTCSVVTTTEYYRRRGAGHDDRTDVPYWEPEDTMTDDDWNKVAGAVEATPAGEPGPKETKSRARKPSKPKAKAKANLPVSSGRSMTENQYVRQLAKLGLSPYNAAPHLGISWRMSYRYSAGTHPIPETVAKLVRAMVTLKALGHDIDV